jgi:hypothetical protein
MPLYCTGPHAGIDHDMEKRKQFREKYPLLPGNGLRSSIMLVRQLNRLCAGEWGLGDLAYGGEERILCSRKNEGGTWTTMDEYWKSLVGFYRARVEKVISRIKNHQWCQQVFRGSLEMFVVLNELSVVLTTLEIRREFQNGQPMFEVIGPWKHSFVP